MDNYTKSYDYQSSRSTDLSGAFATLMRSVYGWMCAALVITALTAMVVAKNSEIVMAIASNKLMFWGLMAAELGLVIYLSSRILKMSFATASLCFIAYSILNGVTMSFIFFVYTMASIAQTFFITAGTFGAMALVGSFIKKDLSTLGRTLMMLLIGLIIASVVNIFHGPVLVSVPAKRSSLPGVSPSPLLPFASLVCRATWLDAELPVL